jgi:hypothetical protein
MNKKNSVKIYQEAEQNTRDAWTRDCAAFGKKERRETRARLWAALELEKIAYRNMNIICSK